MEPRRYSALIRTFNSRATLPATIESLSEQQWPPHRYVFVDSGSTDGTLEVVPAGSIVHRYVGEEFSYSGSLNQGVDHVDTDYVLIVSSHTVLTNPDAVAYAISLLAQNDSIGAAYFCTEDEGSLAHILIDQTNFTGFNGVWNTCAVVKTALLKKRRFRPEVFSAEDQEWSAWLFKTEHKSVARISGGGMGYRNPRKHPMRKRLNENIAVALYVKPEMLGLPYLARVIYRVFRPVSAWRERLFNARLLLSLVRCHFSQPKLKSRYF